MASKACKPNGKNPTCAPEPAKPSFDRLNKRATPLRFRPHRLLPAITALLMLAFAAGLTLGQPVVAAPQPVGCIPNSGWTWTSGPSKPEIAAQAQRALGQAGIEVAVEARSFGETDGCGAFAPTATDFTLSLAGASPLNAPDGQKLADQVYPILSRFGKPSLGNVKLRLSLSGAPGPNDRLQTLTPSAVASGGPQSPASLGQYAFVTLNGDDTVSVLDTHTNTIV
jgi:hypothetical protein